MKFVCITSSLLFFLFLLGCKPDEPKPKVVGGEGEGGDKLGPTRSGETYKAENPSAALWVNFKPGSSIKQRTVTEFAKGKQKSVTTSEWKVLEVTPEKIVLEMFEENIDEYGTKSDNKRVPVTYPRTIQLPIELKNQKSMKQEGLLGEGEETLNIGGQEYKATWTKRKVGTGAGLIESKTWNSKEVPGGLLRDEQIMPAQDTTRTTETIEIKIVK